METSESKSYINFEEQYKKDCAFLSQYEYNFETRDSDVERFLEIAERWDCFDNKSGKYCLLSARAYAMIQKAAYRTAIIRNYEKYLTLEPSESAIRSASILYKEFSNFYPPVQTSAKTDADMNEAKQSHFEQIYFALAREYMEDNDTENAFRCIRKGKEIYPAMECDFDFLLYDVYRKANRLPDFLKFTDTIQAQRKSNLKALIEKAKELIAKGYVFKARKKK